MFFITIIKNNNPATTNLNIDLKIEESSSPCWKAENAIKFIPRIIKDIDVVTIEHNDLMISSMVNGSIDTEYRSTNYISYEIRNIDNKKWLCVTV